MIASPPGEKLATAGPSLNDAQREAVEHGSGPLLVLAGAGSGKTRVLTARIARLIGDGIVRPDQVLAVTFTNKAAGEMRERIGRLLGSDPAGMWVGTFHAIGARMLRANAALVGRTSAFTIYDEDDTLAVRWRRGGHPRRGGQGPGAPPLFFSKGGPPGRFPPPFPPRPHAPLPP